MVLRHNVIMSVVILMKSSLGFVYVKRMSSTLTGVYLPRQDFINNTRVLPNREDSSFAWVVAPPFLSLLLSSPSPSRRPGAPGLFYCLLWLYCFRDLKLFSAPPAAHRFDSTITHHTARGQPITAFLMTKGWGDTSRTTCPVIWSRIIRGLGFRTALFHFHMVHVCFGILIRNLLNQ